MIKDKNAMYEYSEDILLRITYDAVNGPTVAPIPYIKEAKPMTLFISLSSIKSQIEEIPSGYIVNIISPPCSLSKFYSS